MLERYSIDTDGRYSAEITEDGDWVLYEDAAALVAQKDLRIRELEQQLMTEDEKRAAFEKDCG